jgi:AcrR family transcriptional regulator
MARIKRQGVRRAELRAAALRVLAANGVGSTRLKDIAEEAGLTPATVLYYYPDTADLLVEVLRQAMDRFYERRREAVEGLPDARDRLATTIRRGIPVDSRDELARLAWEAIPFEFRNETVAEFDRLYVERQVDLYVSVLELGSAQGHFRLTHPPRVIAANLLALEDYHGLRVLLGWLPADEAVALVVSYAETALHCPLSQEASSPNGNTQC